MLEGGSRRLALVLGTWERGVERRAPSKQRPFSLSQPFFLSFFLFGFGYSFTAPPLAPPRLGFACRNLQSALKEKGQ